MIRCHMRWTASVLLLLASGLSAQQPDSVPARINRIFAAYDRTDSPGCAVGVYSNGAIAFARGYGMANLELNVALSPQSVFDIGSTSKQFTAMSVALLAQQGKLSLDDPVRKYVPELPDYGKPLTIRHILTHTSGLRDYLTLWNLAGVDDSDWTTREDALRLIVAQKELNFEPGEQYLYSNSGFFLASIIVERVSGQTLNQFAQQNMFQPLGMRHTRFNDDHMSVIPNRATGYTRRGNTFATAMSDYEQTGDGAVQTSIEDLFLWDQNFYSGKLGGAALLADLQKAATLNSGTAINYALGLMPGTYRGLPMVSHGGSWAGYRAELMRFPNERLSVAVLCNLAQTSPTVLARQVAEVFLGDRLAPAPPPGQQNPGATPAQPPARFEVKDLTPYAGTYFSPELETSYTLNVDNGVLTLYRRRAQPAALQPTGQDTFTLRGVQFRFTRERGRVTGFLVDAGRTRNLRFERR